MTFLGILILLLSIAGLVLKGFASEGKKVEKEERNRWGDKTGRMITVTEGEFLPFLLKIKGRMFKVAIAAGLLLSLSANFFFNAERGYNYLLVYPNGSTSAVMSPGIHGQFFCKIDKWQKWIDVKTVTRNNEGKIEGDVDELEGIMSPIPLRFIDQVTATGLVSLKFELPKDSKSFIDLAIKYRTMSNLVNNTIIPTAKEQLTNTAYMFAAQDYISGEAQSFRQTYEEQLKMGGYKVIKEEIRDTIYDGDKSRKIKKINTTYKVEKVLGENGLPIRIAHEISDNNIQVSQVIVDDVDLEATFKERLEAQRDESAKRQLEQQKIKTAKDAQMRIIAEGERDKAQEKVNQEMAQVKQVIEVETKRKMEEEKRKLAVIAKQTAEIEAKTKRIKADAEAYEIAKKVHAGITPETRLKMELDAKVNVAKYLSEIKFPQTFIMGTGGKDKGAGGLLEALLGAEMAKGMINKKK